MTLNDSEGAAAVRVHDKWGYIISKGRWIIKPQFTGLVAGDDSAHDFNEGLADVKVGELSGFIDGDGRMKIAASSLW